MNNIQNYSVNFKAGRTISWDQATKYCNFIDKVSKTSFENKHQVNNLLEQYMIESQGNYNWVTQGIIKGVKQGSITIDNAYNLLLKMLKNI